MTSDVIPRLGLDASGTVRGKAMLRKYWGIALERVPDLHFDLIDVYVSPDSLVVFYMNQRGDKICEYLRLNADGKIRQGSANHSALSPLSSLRVRRVGKAQRAHHCLPDTGRWARFALPTLRTLLLALRLPPHRSLILRSAPQRASRRMRPQATFSPPSSLRKQGPIRRG